MLLERAKSLVSWMGRRFFRGDPTDWWMVFLTGLLLVVTYLQYNLGRRTLEVASRAYITASEANVYTVAPHPEGGQISAEMSGKGMFKPGDIPYLEVVLKNTGATPAVRLETAGRRIWWRSFPRMIFGILRQNRARRADPHWLVTEQSVSVPSCVGLSRKQTLFR